MSLAAGALRHRVQLLRRTVVDDGLAVVESWVPEGSPRQASVRRTGGAEEQAGGVVQAVEQLVFRMRLDTTTRRLTTIHRIRWRGIDHVITGIAEDFAMRVWIEAQCSVRADL